MKPRNQIYVVAIVLIQFRKNIIVFIRRDDGDSVFRESAVDQPIGRIVCHRFGEADAVLDIGMKQGFHIAVKGVEGVGVERLEVFQLLQSDEENLPFLILRNEIKSGGQGFRVLLLDSNIFDFLGLVWNQLQSSGDVSEGLKDLLTDSAPTPNILQTAMASA